MAIKQMNTLRLADLHELMLPRPADGHKGTFGHAFIIAGQYGMAGAAVLATRACLRSGVGKATLHTPLRNNDIVQISVPEAIVHHDADEHRFSTPVDLCPYDALAIGPGLGTDAATIEAVGQQLAAAKAIGMKCVVDADALNAIALVPELLEALPAESILTPHPAEYKRMTGDEAPEAFASKHNAYLVLKGHPTRVFTPDGACYECPWGNSGMGTAGSGDVLTGIIAGLLAQHHSPLAAALLGVSLHALAGDAAAEALGEHSLIASDITAHLPAAFRQISEVKQ